MVVTALFFCLEDGGSRLVKNITLEEHSCVISDKSWALQHHIVGERYYAAKGTSRFFAKSHGGARAYKTYTVYGKYSLMTLPVDGWFYLVSIYFCVTQ